MATSSSTPSPRHRRPADRPRSWSQLPWTLLGMAFITTLFLASYQTGSTVTPVDPATTSYQQPAAR